MDRGKMRYGIKQRGFTLIEVMVTLVVLLIGMLGVISMQYYAIGGNTFSREMRIATNLAQQIVEQIKITPYNNLASGTDNPQSDITLTAGVNFTRTWWIINDCIALSLTNDNNSCNPALAAVCSIDPDGSLNVAVSAVKVRTCWTDPKTGVTHSVTLDTARWDENATP
jgi:type IV pilus modification protein PilV